MRRKSGEREKKLRRRKRKKRIEGEENPFSRIITFNPLKRSLPSIFILLSFLSLSLFLNYLLKVEKNKEGRERKKERRREREREKG